MRGTFRVSVTKDYLVFPAAHFITLPGHRCEPLHGHNYRLAVTLDGTVDEECWYVVDFSMVKKLMRQLCEELDHRVLLPTQNPKLQITEEGDAVRVAFEGAPGTCSREKSVCCFRSRTPRSRCSRSCCVQRVVADFRARHEVRLTAVEVEVEENFGQSAAYRELLT